MKLDVDKLQVRGGLIEPTVVWVPLVGHAVAGGDVGLIVSLAFVCDALVVGANRCRVGDEA